MKTIKTTKLRFAQIPLADMEPESGYQRPTNAQQVENITHNFDEAKLGVITVSERDGKFHIVDGQHRSKALRALGYTHAPCMVLTGLTFRQEADYFRKQKEVTWGMRPLHFFKAGLVANDEECLEIDRIVRENGFHIGADSKDFHEIAAVKALLTISDYYGLDVLDDTLYLIATTWFGVKKASHSESLLGVAEFVSRYDIADFTERLKDKFSAISFDYNEAKRIRGLSAREKFCYVLVEHYNKGLAAKSRKRLKWRG